ncbi:hypothetical protein HB884_14735 [Listeria booriae]|uniref:Uncharacterized protein n=1 Tax=Listeria booriae TaxID=1552123 RepID=A0A7X0XC79_9LIST|nr:hypothetical protein [Listeria booriae]MBC1491437.1 hypothetical protein [Listeria booriae]MBC1525463.1 hypothetical protein [Listeria booriae]
MNSGSIENLMANEEYWELRGRNSQAWHNEYLEDLKEREENGGDIQRNDKQTI